MVRSIFALCFSRLPLFFPTTPPSAPVSSTLGAAELHRCQLSDFVARSGDLNCRNNEWQIWQLFQVFGRISLLTARVRPTKLNLMVKLNRTQVDGMYLNHEGCFSIFCF